MLWRRWRSFLCVLSWLVYATPATALGGHVEDTFDDTLTPVLFVHGHGLSSATWQPLVDYLHRHGYPEEYLSAVQITPNRMANISAAETAIAPAVDRLLTQAVELAEKNGVNLPKKVDIVSHSMGAMSSRWYAAKIHPEKVRRWISIAGANHGSNALCQHTDDGAGDLCPAYAKTVAQSEIQLELNGTPKAPIDETPYGIGDDTAGVESIPAEAHRRIAYFTVRLAEDEWIVPADSATLSGAGGIYVEIPDGISEAAVGNFLLDGDSEGHMSILHSERVQGLILRLLTAPETPAQ